MDSALILVFLAGAMFCALYSVGDKTVPSIFRVTSIVYVVPALLLSMILTMAATASPMWNDIEVGPWVIPALGLGPIAFLSREKVKQPKQMEVRR